MTHGHSPNLEDFLDLADLLAARISAFAMSKAASGEEIVKTREISRRVLPALLWSVDNGEIRRDATAFCEIGKLGSFGVAVSVLNRRDIPMALRSVLFPVLRPDAHEVNVKWWDGVAVPQWFAPFFLELESRGEFAGSLSLTAP